MDGLKHLDHNKVPWAHEWLHFLPGVSLSANLPFHKHFKIFQDHLPLGWEKASRRTGDPGEVIASSHPFPSLRGCQHSQQHPHKLIYHFVVYLFHCHGNITKVTFTPRWWQDDHVKHEGKSHSTGELWRNKTCKRNNVHTRPESKYNKAFKFTLR